MNNGHRLLEESVSRYREEAAMLQKRLSERRQECVSLGKDLWRARESARVANETADAVERQLEDLGFAYDALQILHTSGLERIRELENRSLWECFQDCLHRWIMNTATTEAIYYGLPK